MMLDSRRIASSFGEKRFHIVVLILSICLSISGVLFSAFHSRDLSDAGRGGALGAAASFISFFVSRNYGRRTFHALTEGRNAIEATLAKLQGTPTPALNAYEASSRTVGALVKQIGIDASRQHTQNIFVALSAGIGTIFWGFGDVFAKWLMPAAAAPHLIVNLDAIRLCLDHLIAVCLK